MNRRRRMVSHELGERQLIGGLEVGGASVITNAAVQKASFDLGAHRSAPGSVDPFVHMPTSGSFPSGHTASGFCFRIDGAGRLTSLSSHWPPPSSMRGAALVCITRRTYLVGHVRPYNRLHSLMSRLFEKRHAVC